MLEVFQMVRVIVKIYTVDGGLEEKIVCVL